MSYEIFLRHPCAESPADLTPHTYSLDFTGRAYPMLRMIFHPFTDACTEAGHPDPPIGIDCIHKFSGYAAVYLIHHALHQAKVHKDWIVEHYLPERGDGSYYACIEWLQAICDLCAKYPNWVVEVSA